MAWSPVNSDWNAERNSKPIFGAQTVWLDGFSNSLGEKMALLGGGRLALRRRLLDPEAWGCQQRRAIIWAPSWLPLRWVTKPVWLQAVCFRSRALARSRPGIHRLGPSANWKGPAPSGLMTKSCAPKEKRTNLQRDCLGEKRGTSFWAGSLL